MNITPQAPNLSTPTVINPHTESLRRENSQREIITQPAATSKPAAEKGVASDKERGRSPSQNNANIDFASITKQAELANTSITGDSERQNEQAESDGQQSGYSAQESNNDENSAIDKAKSRSQELEYNRVVSELKQRDQEVRSHEAAHAAVGGQYTGAPSFTYEQGPDGRRYAVAGEVSVDLSIIEGDPSATIAKMQKVHAAALAPLHPSAQDIQVASTATQLMLQAQSELLNNLGSKQNEIESQSIVEQNNDDSISKTSKKDGQSNSSKNYEVNTQQTLEQQSDLTASQSNVIVQRALRIESFYADITLAYEKSTTSKFELIA